MITACNVISVELVANHVFRILLHPEKPVNYQAGQYLMVVMGSDDRRPFSIASKPGRYNGELELHIGAEVNNSYASEVVELIQQAYRQGSTINIDMPHGEAWLQPEVAPILLIAGGTGFSYTRSILDEALASLPERDIYLYWGAKEQSQLYALAELTEMVAQYPNMHFVAVVEEPQFKWGGKVGNVLEVVEQDFESLKDFNIYIAGRFEMAAVARERFTNFKQAKRDRIFGDAYAFIK